MSIQNTKSENNLTMTFMISDISLNLNNKPSYEVRIFLNKEIFLETDFPRKISYSQINYEIKIIDIDKIIKDYPSLDLKIIEKNIFIETYKFITSLNYNNFSNNIINLDISFV